MANKENDDTLIKVKLKCTACGSSNVHSIPYKYKQLAEKNIFKLFRNKKGLLFSLDVPICFACKKKFHNWNIFNKFSITIFILGISTVISGIFFLILHQVFEDIGVPTIGFGFLFSISSLIFRFIIGRINSNPNNFFFYDFINMVFYVKPKEKKDWISYNSWIRTIIEKNNSPP